MRNLGLLLVLLLASNSAALAGTSLEQILEIGERQFNDGDFQPALRVFKAAKKASDGACLPCESGIARCQLALERYPATIRRARAALQLGAGAEMQIVLGRGLIGGAGDKIAPNAFAEAETIFRTRIEAGDRTAGLYLGVALARMGQDEAAGAALHAYLEQAPEDAKGRLRANELLDRPYCARRSCLPTFEVEALDGTLWNNASLDDQVVLLDFWATWCEPCVDSIPHLRKIVERHREAPFRLISFSIDDKRSALDFAIERFKMNWPQVWDPTGETIRDRFRVGNYPTYVLVDRRGIVRAQFTGWGPTHARDLDETIELLLAETATDD